MLFAITNPSHAVGQEELGLRCSEVESLKVGKTRTTPIFPAIHKKGRPHRLPNLPEDVRGPGGGNLVLG